MRDLIDRQAAIDAMNKRARDTFTLASGYKYYLGALHDIADDIKKLPSAQPEVDCQKCVFNGFPGFKQFQAEQIDPDTDLESLPSGV